jgi:hypothetical protein
MFSASYCVALRSLLRTVKAIDGNSMSELSPTSVPELWAETQLSYLYKHEWCSMRRESSKSKTNQDAEELYSIALKQRRCMNGRLPG